MAHEASTMVLRTPKAFSQVLGGRWYNAPKPNAMCRSQNRSMEWPGVSRLMIGAMHRQSCVQMPLYTKWSGPSRLGVRKTINETLRI